MRALRVLVACEYSGAVRDAFTARGHLATSCDLLEAETQGEHYQGDVRDLLQPGLWDLGIGFPPCFDLAVSGARWFAAKGEARQAQAVEFARTLLTAPIPFVAIENPVGVLSSRLRKPDQIIQPWMFGHGETKATCLWLSGLPPLRATNIVEGREARILNISSGPNRWKERSRTYSGIAQAMADQWSTAALSGYGVQALWA